MIASRGCAWPGGEHLLRAAGRAASFLLLFVAVYGMTDWITGLHSWRVPMHFAFELGIPLVPAAAWVYMSLYLLTALVPFVLRTAQELDAFVSKLRGILGTAAVLFLLVPAEVAYAPAVSRGASGALLAFADRINLDHNLLPSLHVALAVVSAQVMAARLGFVGAFLMWLWALAIAGATLLAHQHHVLDVVSGFALARWAPSLLRKVRTAPIWSTTAVSPTTARLQSIQSESEP